MAANKLVYLQTVNKIATGAGKAEPRFDLCLPAFCSPLLCRLMRSSHYTITLWPCAQLLDVLPGLPIDAALGIVLCTFLHPPSNQAFIWRVRFACLAEVENHLQISDSTVAEFIVELATAAKGNVDKFKKVRCMYTA